MRMHWHRSVALWAALCSAAVVSADIQMDWIVLRGQPVTDEISVTTIDNLSVNSHGEWVVHVNTTPGAVRHILRGYQFGPFFSYLAGGTPLSAPPGTSISTVFQALELNDNGNIGWNFSLTGAVTTSTDSGIFLNTTLVIQESDISQAPQFTPGTPYIGFFRPKINNHDEFMLMASVDDPAIATTVDRALVLVRNPTGAFTEQVIWKEGDILPGQVNPVADFNTAEEQWGFNDNGDVLFCATPMNAIYLNDVLLAQPGMDSPVADRPYNLTNSRPRGLNNHGDWVLRATITGDTATNEILVKNGAVVVQKGDSFPAIAPYEITSFGGTTSPLLIDDLGNIYWYGIWSDPDTARNEGWFRNHELIIRKGMTFGAVPLTLLRAIQAGFAISDNGEWMIARGQLEGGLDVALLVRFPLPAPENCPGDANGDGVVNFADISPFIAAIKAGSASTWTCDLAAGFGPYLNSDANGDEVVNFADISPFIALLKNPPDPCVSVCP
ncbi:MAG: hypothetical protein IPM18_02040 [Phycisphaerales bacterium]|nr:hypothetical protein [Phycisphaerales bacterium]